MLEFDKYSQNVAFVIFFTVIAISNIYCYMTHCLNAIVHLLINLQFGWGLHLMSAGRADTGLLPSCCPSMAGRLVVDLDGSSTGNLSSVFLTP